MARKVRYQPAFERTPYRLGELVEEVRATCFPQIPRPVPVFFTVHEPLACAVLESDELAFPAVYFHQVLNHPETPIEVARFIAKHELLHLVVPAQKRGRFVDAHPPEFWDAEERVAPEGPMAWGWLWANLHGCLHSQRRNQRLVVRPAWKALEFGPRLPWHAAELQLYLQTHGDRSPRRLKRRPNVQLRRGRARPTAGQPAMPGRA